MIILATSSIPTKQCIFFFKTYKLSKNTEKITKYLKFLKITRFSKNIKILYKSISGIKLLIYLFTLLFFFSFFYLNKFDIIKILYFDIF